ncbi:glycosyltransferase [Candidatus Pelagibacter bacterium]|nr:glycosyltransferase [Candidatus Pelagibacter bacterium]MDA8836193.1 glycosyltransferase [Candidatus Pelagibacter bacterium]
MKKISIVTVVLNQVRNIEQTIKSVLNQNYQNLEYIVIDGGSTDGTLEILNKYKNKFKYFKSSSDKGIYDAMNKGIAQASGDLIGFVNGGDFIYEKTLDNINLSFSQQKKDYFFSVSDIDYVDKDSNVVGSKICRSNERILKRKYLEMPTNHLGIFVPLKAFKDVGLFDLKFNFRADFFFVLKLIRNGYQPLNVKKKIGAFRLGGKSGGYSTFLENFKIIRNVGGNLSDALYSTFLGVSKLFFQRNFPIFYKYIAKAYYQLNIDVQNKEIFIKRDLKVIHIIDSDSGGGAEKLVMSLQKNLKSNQKIVTLKKLNEKNNYNSNYESLNIKAGSLLTIFLAIFGIIKILFRSKDKTNLVLHSHLSKSLYATFIPSVLFGIKHIHTEHNTYNKRRSKLSIYPLEYLIYNSLKHIICISEPTRFELLSYMPSIKLENISVIENGTKLYTHKMRNFTKQKLNILVLGSLTFKKGIDLFIESLPSLLHKINQVKIIGSGSEKKNLTDLTKKLSLESYIKFIPFVDDPLKYIYESDVGVIPSRWEGFGLVAAEMRSSGLPILISDTPGLYNIFSSYNGVYNFKTGSKESLINSFTFMQNDLTDNIDNIKDLSLDLETYSEESFIKRYDNFYKSLKNL